jgi:hypothetical protein
MVERVRPKLTHVFGTTRDQGKLSTVPEMKLFPFDSARHVSPLSASPPQGGRERASPPPLRGRDREGGRTIRDALAGADLVLIAIPPDENGDPVLRYFRAELAAANPKSVVYLSTVGVYGDHGGAWVDETSECRPVSKRSTERLAAETEWRRFASEAGVPVAIVRLAGIYGPGRGPFEKIRQGSARRIIKPGQVFNRIHVDDIAQIVEAAFARRADGIFNGVDDEPAPPEDVLAYAAGLLGRSPPPSVPFESAELSPMARSFYGESKRVRNDKMKRGLGVQLAYPTYREGLAAVLKSG